MERRFAYRREDRHAAEWGAMVAPVEILECEACGCDSERGRCEDCEREIGGSE